MSVNASLTPQEFLTTPGVSVRLNAMSSSDTTGEDVTFSWELTQVPLGSVLTSADLLSAEETNGVVLLTPDQPGTYLVTVTVTNESLDTATAQSTVSCQYVLGFTQEPTTPDASYLFEVVGDFWRIVNSSDMLSVLWSGYTQVVGTDLSRAYQAGQSKSLATIRNSHERRWLPYHPLVSLLDYEFEVLLGDVQGGTSARTTDDSQEATAVVISHQEVVLLGVPASDLAVGQELSITSGGNVGAYTVLRQNSDNTGYVVRRNSLNPAADIVAAGADMYGLRTSTVLSSVSVDFAAAGVVAGDVVKLVAGADSNYYTITAVGLSGGLTSNKQVQISSTLIRNRTGMSFSILRPVSVVVDFPGTAYATKIFLPTTEADLSVYEAPRVAGTATVRGAYEIIVSPRHVFDSMVGKQVEITTGTDAGIIAHVGAVNGSRDGYILTTALSSVAGASIGYSLLLPYAVTDRLITVGGVTVPMLAVARVGSEWVVTVPTDCVPAGLTNATWYVGNVCTLTGVDVTEHGASIGDVLKFSVRDVRSEYTTTVNCAVLGAYGNKLMFTAGSTMPAVSAGTFATYGLTDKELYTFFSELLIPTAEYDGDTETATLSRIAQSVVAGVSSTAFAATNFNVPLSDETIALVDVVSFSVRPTGFVRNTKLSVDDYLLGVPALFQYVRDPVIDSQAGTTTVTAADSTITEVETPPAVLQQNDQFVVYRTRQLRGNDAEISAGTDQVVFPSEALWSFGIEPGDTVELRFLGDYYTYVVTQVVDEQTARVRPTTGSSTTFALTQTNLLYRFTRKRTKNYLRFANNRFSSTAPAPEKLWAEISLFDNAPTIEDNFGTLVGVTKDELDSFGEQRTDYLSVVRGLAFSLVNGPTVENVNIGANLLLGGTVSVHDGIVSEVDDNFSTTQGRIIIEDVDSFGSPTATFRSYTYTKVGYGAPGFIGVAANPVTGEPITEGDAVLQYQVLSNAVQVTDYVNDPSWWSRYRSLSGRELEKFHTWQLVADLQQVPGEDFSLVSRFVADSRPVYTRPALVGLLYLSETVTVETDLLFDGTILLFDDPAFSTESTHMVDDYDGGSVALRATDTGAFSSRTLFRGRDLVTTNGDGSGELLVTSARGGFVDPLTSPLNEYFGPIETRGSAFVKAADDTVKYPGDVLVILSGANTGSYEISEVVDDTTLRIRKLDTFYFSTYSPESPSPDTMLAGEGQEFVIQRADGPLIWFGVGEATAGSQNIVATGGNFIVNRVAPGDRLLIVDSSGAPYEDTVVAVTRSVEGTQESDTIVAEKESTASGSVEVYVYREALLQNPLLVSNIAATAAGTSVITGLQHAGSFIRKGDVVEIVNSPVPSDVGKTFEIAGIPSPADIIVKLGGGSLGTAFGVTIRVTRPALDAAATDSDTSLEVLWTGEYAELDVMRPMTVLFTGIVDAVVDVATRTVTSASSDFVAGGVTPGMRVELQSVVRNAGVYVIESVGVTDLTLEVPPNDDEVSAPLLTVLAPAVEFIVDPTGVVTTVSSYHLRGDLANDPFVASVEPGDIFEYDDMIQIMISEVSDYSFRLSRTPPVIGTFAGRIFRTEQT